MASATAAAVTSAGLRTPPPGVAWLEDGLLEPGTYWFDGFEPWLQITIPDGRWEVGHFHDQFFDLFRECAFPAIGFARFPTVATPASSEAPRGSAVPVTSVDQVIERLRSIPDLVVTEVGPASVAGLTGRTIDVVAKVEQTPLFGAGSDGYKIDPGVVLRLHVLAVEGGVMEAMVVGRDGQVEAAIEATQPILDSLVVLG